MPGSRAPWRRQVLAVVPGSRAPWRRQVLAVVPGRPAGDVHVVVRVMPRTVRWFDLYPATTRRATAPLLCRCGRCGAMPCLPLPAELLGILLPSCDHRQLVIVLAAALLVAAGGWRWWPSNQACESLALVVDGLHNGEVDPSRRVSRGGDSLESCGAFAPTLNPVSSSSMMVMFPFAIMGPEGAAFFFFFFFLSPTSPPASEPPPPAQPTACRAY